MATYKRATTDEEKREIVERLYKLWTHEKFMRLSQLMLNVYRQDFYHVEDYDFLDTLEAFYKKLEESSKTTLPDK
jgi:hypothetical protein